jgi:branched-chain amino acid transport system ATP-binding protein
MTEPTRGAALTDATSTRGAGPPSAVTAERPALRLSNITAGYGRTTVLRDVSVNIAKSEIVALLGPNGAGKTTLMRTASGLLRPSAGAVEINGADVTGTGPAKRAQAGLCLIPEGRGIWRNLTVRENLRLQVPPWAPQSSVEVAADMFPVLADRFNQLAGTLSGGEQQMLALSRSYLSDPSVVLLDEVSMGLAPKVVDEIFVALRKLADTGVSLLLVEQYVTRALEMADRAVLLDRGQVSFDGLATDLDEQAVLQGYLGVQAVGS